MANTYSSLFFHVVFSTKNRKPWIRPEIENRVWSYIGGIARTHGLKALQVGGIKDMFTPCFWRDRFIWRATS